jgi:large subunit ribosomal protein L25
MGKHIMTNLFDGKVIYMEMELHAHTRNDTAGSVLKSIRDEGNIPAILYGSKIPENEMLYVDSVEFTKLYQQVGQHGVFTLMNGDGNHSVMVHEAQRDPLKNEYVHVDFFEVDMTKEVTAEVPVHFEGNPNAPKDCLLQQGVRQLKVRALPNEVPDVINVDVSGLSVNESLQIKDISENCPYEIQHEPEEVIVSVLPPKTYEDQPDSESDVAGEPDVINGPSEEREE